MKWLECPVRSVFAGTAMMFVVAAVLYSGMSMLSAVV